MARDIEERVGALERVDILAGRLVGPVDLLTGANQIRHGLRRARGRITVQLSAVVDLTDTDTEGELWTVTSSGAATATFWFF